jgi:hypothetical protein
MSLSTSLPEGEMANYGEEIDGDAVRFCTHIVFDECVVLARISRSSDGGDGDERSGTSSSENPSYSWNYSLMWPTDHRQVPG